MKLLDTELSESSFFTARFGFFNVFLDEVYHKRLSSTEQESFIENLDRLIGLKQLDNIPTTFNEKALDCGLIYQEQDTGVYRVKSSIALDSLFRLMKFYINSVAKPVLFDVRIVFL